MKRALVLALAVAAVVTGCGGGSGSGSSAGSSSGGSSATSVSSDTAAGVLTAASSASQNATSAAFQANLGLKVSGNLQGAGAGAAILQGPLSLGLKGHAGKGADGKPKFDVNFSFNYTGGSFSGRALSADGKVLYLQMPALMGPGWHSVPLSGLTSQGAGSSGSSTSEGLAQLKAAGLDPAKWLKNLSLTQSGGEDTISADLNLPAVFADIAKAGESGITAKDKLQMAQVVRAVKKAHGSLSFDSSTHLPTDEQLQFDMVLPPALAAQASGLKGISMNLDIKFSDWNQDFTVSAPSGATPLNTGGLLGGLGA
jgi:hypothetical protein